MNTRSLGATCCLLAMLSGSAACSDGADLPGGVAASAGGGGPGGSPSSGATTESTASASTTSGSGGAGPGGGSGQGGGTAACVPVDLSAEPASVAMPAGCPGPTCTSIGLTPVSDLEDGEYRGLQGGLYCGSNQPPAAYAAKGVALGNAIVPRDAAGAPDPDGKYAMVSIGMSHTTMEFSAFIAKYQDNAQLDPHLVLVDGALSGHTTVAWLDPANEVWSNLGNRLSARGVSDAQVAVAWVKLARKTPQEQCTLAGIDGPCFPAYEAPLAEETRTILGMLRARFPNLTLVYLASRSYGGYASSDLNPDPFAYGSAFAMKKLIVEGILDAPAAQGLPWLGWGPYLWADGTHPRSDGLTWSVDDFIEDGTHPGPSGREKVADALFEHFHTDPTATPWFVAP